MAKKNEFETAYEQMLPKQGGTQPKLDSLQTADNLNKLAKNYGVGTPYEPPMTQPQATISQNAPSQGGAGGGMLEIRNELSKRGIDNNTIGWNDATKNVMLGGKDVYKPSRIENGVSYGSEQDINKMTNEYYSSIGKPLRGADAYVAKALGVKNAVSWSNGNLMVGGQIVPTVYVDGKGTAYAHQSDLDNAIASYKRSSGITGNREVLDNWNSKYGSDIKKALDAVTRRKEWSYDPENDAVYRAYRDQYTREGNRAYQDAYAQMAANTSGYGSSAAMNAASQQLNYYMQQLGDRIPELMQNDYNRYLGEYELRRQALDSLREVANDEYNREYQTNRDIISDINAANEASYNRRRDARTDYEIDREYALKEPIYRNEIKKNDIDTERYAENADLELEERKIAVWEAKAQKVLTQLGYSGNIDAPISAEAANTLGIEPKEDGSYPSYSEIVTSMAKAEGIPEKVLWEMVTKPELDYRAGLR